MSWDQAVQERDTLPESFVAWADRQAEKRGWSPLAYVTWFGSDRSKVYLDYGESGSLTLSL
jgi:hypothetical protein